jgi:hypothetical protein
MTPSVLALAAMMFAAAAPPDDRLDPRVSALLEAVSEERLAAILQKLGSFETRHTLSSADSPARGIGAAREWILAEMKGYSPRLQVSFDTHDLPKQGERVTRDVELRNVMAVLPGKSPRRLYVSGHYDSVARRPRTPPAQGGAGGPESPPASNRGAGFTPAPQNTGFDWTVTDNLAPGVNDDGSGTALTMELARVFAQSGLEFEATLVFIALAGEEQGLYGARLHAARAVAEKWTIDAVLNNDIVGNERGGQGQVDSVSVRVFSEGPEDSPSRQLARHVRRQAERYLPAHAVRLIARYDRFGRGGDHSAFNQKGFAAVRFTESKENFARQHTVEDTFEGVSPAYLARNARVNGAALAVLALAPAAPAVGDERGRPLLDRGASGYDARLRWKAAPGAAGYRVFWREAWTPDWQQQRTVVEATELVLPGVSIDDYVFGVAALSPEGNESLVSAYVNPRRAEAEVETRPRTGGGR